MFFCSECGAQLADGAQFCASCGVPTGVVVPAASLPAMEKIENTRRCPTCNAEVSAIVAVCPSCGHEFSEVKVSSSIQDFFERLNSAATDKQKLKIIRNFSIPNSKEDILEFIIMGASRIKKVSANATSKHYLYLIYTLGLYKKEVSIRYNSAWRKKCREAYAKAKIVFMDDTQSLAKIEVIMAEFKGKEKKAFIRVAIIVAATIAMLVLVYSGTLYEWLLQRY